MYMVGAVMCDKISMALAAQALAALSIEDYKGAWKLANELKRRWSMEPDTKRLGCDEQQKANDAHPAQHLKLKVS